MTHAATLDHLERADCVLAAIPLLVLGGLAGGLVTGFSLALASGVSLVAASAVVGSALFSDSVRPD